MILLDTDHWSVFALPGHSQRRKLVQRMESADEPLAITVITVEEQFRGWMGAISKRRHLHDQIPDYDRLREFVALIEGWQIVRFDTQAADEFLRIRKLCRRMATADLKIAAIALVNDALLLTANLRDFRQVPNLRVENWLS